MIKFRPIGNRVLLKRMSSEKKTPGGLIIPGSSAQKSSQAVVVKVGRGKVCDNGMLIPPCVRVGEHVVAEKRAGQDIKVEGQEFWLVRDHDIAYVVDHDEDIADDDE